MDRRSVAIGALLTASVCAAISFSSLLVLGSQKLTPLDRYVGLVGLAVLWLSVVSAAWRLRALLQQPRHARHALLAMEFTLYAAGTYVALPTDLRGLSIPGALCLTGASLLLQPIWLRSVAAALSAAIVLLLNWLRIYEIRFGQPAVDTYAAVFQTDTAEGWSYFASQLTARSLIVAGCVGLVMLCMRPVANRIAQSVASPGRKRLLEPLGVIVGLVLVMSAFSWGPLKARVKTYRKSYSQFVEEVAIQKRLLAELSSTAAPEKNLAEAAKASFEGTVVFVMGESITRRHLALYGYHRETTPNLERRRGELIVHRDTISPHSHTAESLREILTAASVEDDVALKDAFGNSLMIELRRSGYKTWWLSTQHEFGIWENPVSLLGKHANVAKFLRTSSGKVYRGGFYDEILLPHLDAALADDSRRKFVFLHTMAGHIGYCHFIPEDKRKVLKAADGLGKKYFGRANDRSREVNCYDNAIRYADEFLEQVIRRLDARAEPALLTYLSDHGEDADYGTSHNSAKHTAYHVEVPHLWYFNAAARRVLDDELDSLSNNLDAPYNTSGHFHTLLDLVGVDVSRFTPARSLVSDEFVPRKRVTMPRDDLGLEAVAYDDLYVADRKDYLEFSRLVLEDLAARLGAKNAAKLWSHRTNSIGKLLEAKDLFGGVELDVVYEADMHEFYVYHPPMQSTGLALEEYLAAARGGKYLQLWFDWKNAEPQNFDVAMARLEALDGKFALKGRLIVETPTKSTFAALSRLTAYGFRHAYYLPTAEIARCSESPRLALCDALAGRIAATMRSIGATILSFDASGRRFIDHNREKFGEFRQIIWLLDLSTANREMAKRLPDLGRYEAALVSFPSRMSY